MERQEIISTLEALANGVDPVTGHPVDRVFTAPDVIRALFGAAKLLTDPPRNNMELHRARNKALVAAGARWTHEEDLTLSGEYRSGMNIVEIATRHGRTQTAITMRLTKLGLIIQPFPDRAEATVTRESHGSD